MNNAIHFKVYQPYPSRELADAAAKLLRESIEVLSSRLCVYLRQNVSVEEVKDFYSGIEWYVKARFSIIAEGAAGIHVSAPQPQDMPCIEFLL